MVAKDVFIEHQLCSRSSVELMSVNRQGVHIPMPGTSILWEQDFHMGFVTQDAWTPACT